MVSRYVRYIRRTTAITACESCVAGKYSSAEGVGSSVGCNDCSPGKYSATTTDNVAEDTTCIPCAAGFFTPNTGAVQCDRTGTFFKP